jgi:hypothetical protein
VVRGMAALEDCVFVRLERMEAELLSLKEAKG